MKFMSEPTPAPASNSDDPKKRLREKVDKLLAREPCKSEGSILQDGRTFTYRAIAEFIPVSAGGLDEKRGDPEAAIFTTSYFLADASVTARPVLFVFNGGPGSSSIWLHLGALGPKRVVIRDDGTMPAPPYVVTDNPESWFEHFDLVFIDPPHTGYSITASDDARKKMLGVDGDVDALAECIRTWLGRHRRWGSPIYLAGESYGTTRGAALADKLQTMGCRAVRPDSRLLCDGPAKHRLRAAQRSAVCAVRSGVRLHRAIPRQAHRSTGGVTGGCARGGRKLRQRGLSDGAARRRSPR
jgi:carboxypeptidase C (cathepsin A)